MTRKRSGWFLWDRVRHPVNQHLSRTTKGSWKTIACTIVETSGNGIFPQWDSITRRLRRIGRKEGMTPISSPCCPEPLPPAGISSLDWPYNVYDDEALTWPSNHEGHLSNGHIVASHYNSCDSLQLMAANGNAGSAATFHRPHAASFAHKIDLTPLTPAQQYIPSTPSPSTPSPPRRAGYKLLSIAPAPSPKPKSNLNDDQNRKFQCRQCDRRFLREYTRKVHEMTHQPKVQQPFRCGVANCDSRFSRRHDRLRHEVLKHGQECEWTCEVCGKFFSVEKTFERHVCIAYRR